MKFTIQMLIEESDQLPLLIPIHTIERPCERVEDIGLHVGCEFVKFSSGARRCTIPHVEFQVWYGLRHARSYGFGDPFARHLGEASASGRRARRGRRILDPQASTGHRRSFTQTCSELDIL